MHLQAHNENSYIIIIIITTISIIIFLLAYIVRIVMYICFVYSISLLKYPIKEWFEPKRLWIFSCT